VKKLLAFNFSMICLSHLSLFSQNGPYGSLNELPGEQSYYQNPPNYNNPYNYNGYYYGDPGYANGYWGDVGHPGFGEARGGVGRR